MMAPDLAQATIKTGTQWHQSWCRLADLGAIYCMSESVVVLWMEHVDHMRSCGTYLAVRPSKLNLVHGPELMDILSQFVSHFFKVGRHDNLRWVQRNKERDSSSTFSLILSVSPSLAFSL